MLQSPADLRLPGVYFLPPRRAPGLGLPPLDVAGFVGFAERGPLHLPVPVEDVNTYRAVFGGDLALAQEPGGRVEYACLPRVVEAFFDNGGRRCYVVRVAGSAASPTRLRLPGVVSLSGASSARLASLQASSPGSWSAALRLASRLLITPLPLAAFALQPDGALAWQAGAAPQTLQPGDVLRLAFDDGSRWLFPVAQVSPLPGSAVTLRTARPWRLLDGLTSSPPLDGPAGLERLDLDGARSGAAGSTFASDAGGYRVSLHPADVPHVGRRSVLKLRLSDGLDYLMPVEGRRAVTGSAGTASPPAANGAAFEAFGSILLRLSPEPLPAASLVRVERLRFDLLLRLGDQPRPSLSGLAFNAPHARFWGEVALLESSTLGDPAAGRSNDRQNSLPDAARAQESPAAQAARLFHQLTSSRLDGAGREAYADPRLLAGLLAPLQAGEGLTFLPLDMPAVVAESDFTAPEASQVGSDGLQTFAPDLFLDPYLVPQPPGSGRSESAPALLSAAFDRQYIQERRLFGLHSLMFVDEVALLSIPDAVHRPWESAAPAAPPRLPKVEALPAGDPCPSPAPFFDCLQPPIVTSVDPGGAAFDLSVAVTITGSGFTTTQATQVTFGDQVASDVQVLSSSVLVCTSPLGVRLGPVAVTVHNANGAGSLERGFVYLSPSTLPRLPVLQPAESYQGDALDGLLVLQRALLNFCQARGDVFGLLSLPLHFEKSHCLEWQAALRSFLGLPPRGVSLDDLRDLADLSYAAVYHPWLLLSDPAAPDRLRPTPPDGAVCGMLAARERSRGVWVAPANLPLRGVLGLQPLISTDDWADLFARQFNLLRSEAADFRAMSAHTLSDERSLLQISVRRLMILVRKAALQRGMDFVFESNHERFREAARSALEDMLRFMFQRGAFAGLTEAAAFRVLTDASVNPPQSVDQGRFIAVIQVAPSQPMEFITVLLTRTGAGELQASEA